MTDPTLASAFANPIVSLLLTVVVAGVTAFLTTRAMLQRPAAEPAAPVVVQPSALGAPVSPPALEHSDADDPALIAAIAAAVCATVGRHRLVYVGEARSGSGWTNELRSRHHTSHAPHTPHATPMPHPTHSQHPPRS